MTMTNAIQKANSKAKETAVATSQPKTLQDYVQKMQGQIARALPAAITPERFSRIVLTAISSNPKLQECTPQSFLGAMMTSAQLGLEPNTPLGQSYLIPRNTKRKDGTFATECTFQLGYKGMIDLAYRSGDVVNIGAYTVYSGDTFEVEFGLDPRIKHIPALKNRGEPIAFYAYYKTRDGGFGFDVMSVEDAREHAKRFSESVKRGWSSPWDTNFEEMAKKTVLKKVLKYAPLRTEVASQVAMDDTIHDTVSDSMVDEPVYYPAEVIDGETGEVIKEESK